MWSIGILKGVNPRAVALSLTGARLFAVLTGVVPEVNGMYSCVALKNNPQVYGLGDHLMQALGEEVLSRGKTEFAEVYVGRCLKLS